jgi:hypothetical protein
VIFAILGAVVLVLKPAYRGPLEDVVHSYAGNFSVAFALYFAAINTTERYRRPRLTAALATLLAVEAFELSNGFGVMANVFDPVDLLANAVGVGFAILVDAATARPWSSGADQGGTTRRRWNQRMERTRLEGPVLRGRSGAQRPGAADCGGHRLHGRIVESPLPAPLPTRGSRWRSD